MSGWCSAPVWPSRATTSSASTRTTAKVAMLRRGKVPIYEPGLEELVKRNKAEGRLIFTTELPKAVRAAEIIFIAVGTPQGEDGSADLQHVHGRRPRHRARDERLQGHRQQEHRAGRHRREGARGRSPRDHASLQRGQQSRVPEAGRGGRRLHEARSRGDWRRGSARRRADGQAAPAVHAHRRADHGDGLRRAPSSRSTPRTRSSRPRSRS